MGGWPSGWLLFILQKKDFPGGKSAGKKLGDLLRTRFGVEIDSQMTFKCQYNDMYWLFFYGKIVV